MNKYQCLWLFLTLSPVGLSISLLDDWSGLRCLSHEKPSPCLSPPDQHFRRNVSQLSRQLIEEFSKLNTSLKRAIRFQNFSDLEKDHLRDVSGGILLSLSVRHLSELHEDVLSDLLLRWVENESVFKHLARAFLFSIVPDVFFNMLLSNDFRDENLEWISQVASRSVILDVRNLFGKLPLIFYSPPQTIVNCKPERLFYLDHWEESCRQYGTRTPAKPVLRLWAYALVKEAYPASLSTWNDNFYINRLGFLLPGAITNELDLLNADNLSDLSGLFRFNFSPIQARFLFDKFYSGIHLSEKVSEELGSKIGLLLPSQLLSLPLNIENSMRNLSAPTYFSYSSSRQILELISASSILRAASPAGGRLDPVASRLLRVLPPKDFLAYFDHRSADISVSRSSLLYGVQSPLLSKIQMYLITRKYNVFEFESGEIFKCSDYFKVLPASLILSKNVASNALFHILANVDPTNLPLAYVLLNKIWPGISSAVILKEILKNRKSDELLSIVPSRCYSTRDIEDFKRANISLNKLPRSFISTVSDHIKETSHNFKFENLDKNSIYLFSSVTCDDIESIDPHNFILFLTKYNIYLEDSNNVMTKKLEMCCMNKLLQVLQIKSFLAPESFIGSKLSLLNEAEIDAIGGVLLSRLPVESVRASRHSLAIVRGIGSLSVSRLLSDSSLEQLGRSASLLLQTTDSDGKISSSLFDLGNLTLFLEPQYINKINEEYFRLLVESEFLDRRVCGDEMTRLSWFNLLRRSFGEPRDWSYQTLHSLGDLLIVVPENHLLEIRNEPWIYVADVLASRYHETEPANKEKFYKTCLSKLREAERPSYQQDLENHLLSLVRASQLQIDTITLAETILQKKEQTHSGEVFHFINSKKDIKFSFPTVKKIIAEPESESQVLEDVSQYSDSRKVTKELLTTYEDMSSKPVPSGRSVSEHFDVTTSIPPSADSSRVETTVGDFPATDYSGESTANREDSDSFPRPNLSTVPLPTDCESNHLVINSTGSTEPLRDETSAFTWDSSGLFSTGSLESPLGDSTEQVFPPTTSSPRNLQTLETDSYIDDVITSTGVSTTGEPSTTIELIQVYSQQSLSKLGESAVSIETEGLTSHRECFKLTWPQTDRPIQTSTSSKRLPGFSNVFPLHSKHGFTQRNINPTPDAVQSDYMKTVLSSPIQSPPSLDNSRQSVRLASLVSVITPPLLGPTSLSPPSQTSQLSFDNSPDLVERRPLLSSQKYYFSDENSIDKKTEGFNQNENDFDSGFLRGRVGFKKTENIISSVPQKRNSEETDKIHLLKANRFDLSNLKKEHFLNSKPLLLTKKKTYVEIKKRSTNERVRVSCEALKMVGRAVEIILNETLTLQLSEDDLMNCIGLFAELDLTYDTQRSIWKRINLDVIAFAGKLVAAAKLPDLKDLYFNATKPWSLENISILGKYNTDPNVREELAVRVLRGADRLPLRLELAAALGSLLCDLPPSSLSPNLLSPPVLLKVSVLLGRELSCRRLCLGQLAQIALHDTAYGDPSNWTAADVRDLGVIVSGLNGRGWKALLDKNPEALNGLTEAAYDCLPYKYINMLKRIPVDVLPRQGLQEVNTLEEFDFNHPQSLPEPSSLASSLFSRKPVVFSLTFIVFLFVL